MALDPGSFGPRFQQFLADLERPVVFFDIEATGTDAARDRIVELSLLRVNGSHGEPAIEQAKTWRVDPRTKIPIESVRVHGITNEDLKGAPRFSEIADEVVSAIDGCDLGGFAITRMDVRMLEAELRRAGKQIDLGKRRLVDAQVIYHRREPRNLAAALSFYCDLEHEAAHGAEADTVAALRVFAGQLERYDDLEVGVDSLHKLSTSLSAGYVDRGRRFVWRDDEPMFNFGKLKGQTLRWAASAPEHRRYLHTLIEGPFDDEVKDLVREALAGTIRRKT